MQVLRVLFLGDIVGEAGCAVFQKHINHLRQDLGIDALVVNGENSGSVGRGLTPRTMHFFKHHQVDVVTSGNHIWAAREIYTYLSSNQDLLRPANFPSGCPGTGITFFERKGHIISIINLQGRIFMREHLDCPFRTMDSLLSYARSRTNLIFVDFHAEATSEKIALAHYLDGRVSALVGTHTHVQTADERVLPGGTAFISDLGMAGALNSSLGVKKDGIIHNFLTQMPVKFEVETTAPFIMTGVVIEVEVATGTAVSIERVKILDNELQITPQKAPQR
jgi:2',3'-cyclic-nucleotide 2'-phosphodiesterase